MPIWFDWAAEVNRDMGLGPITSAPTYPDHTLPKPTITLSNDDVATIKCTPTTVVPTTPHTSTFALLTDPTAPAHIPPQCAHPRTAPPLSTCLSHLPLSTPTPAMQHLTHPCLQTLMAPLLNAPLAPTLHQQTPRPSLYSWQPAQLCLQCSPRQLCMDCVISWLFVQTHKIPGAV